MSILSKAQWFPRWRSTRLRIGAAFSVLAVVLFIAIGAVSGEEVGRMRQRDAGDALQQAADRLAQTLSVGLAERYREISHAAQMQPLVGRRLDADGWRGWLQQLQHSFPHYTWIGVANGDGHVLAATGGLLEGRDVSQREWFSEGLRGPWLGDVHEAKLLASLLPATPPDEPLRLFDIAAPVAGSGQHQVLGAHLSLAWAEEQRRATLASMPALAGVEMYLLNGRGAPLLGPSLRDPAALGRLQGTLQRGAVTRVWEDGRRYLTASSRVAAVGPAALGWTVLVRQPEAVALAEAHTMRHRMWAIGLVGAVLFGLGGWWLAGRLTAPLRQVAEAARSAAEATGAPMPAALDEVGQLASALSRLLTQLRDRERSLVQLNGSLEQRVLERTASLRQANEDLSLFARSISHDLKGPIGSMAMLLRNVLEDDQALRQASRLSIELLAAECDRLGELTQGLLDLGRLEQCEMHREHVRMRDLVEQVVASLRREGRVPPGTEVVIGALPEADGDAVLMRQVWHNLLANAFKFSTGASTPRVEVHGAREGDELVYRVLDNGVGFDPAQQHRLFGAFQRLHASSAFAGTGLGLSIVQRLVQRHGGRVAAEVRRGGGAQFSFALPVRLLSQGSAMLPETVKEGTA
jgi:signal transduction histidine kinase